jgi:hypothetical protein
MAFWTLWSIDAVIAIVFGYFFAVGLADGSVSSFNIGLWTIILITLAAVLLGAHTLRSAGHASVSLIVLAVVAAPGLLAALFFIAVLILNPRWN